MTRFLAVLAVCLSVPLGASQAGEISGKDIIISGKGVAVDGDTIVLDGITIRLQGMDAPELKWPSGQYAKSFMQAMLDSVIVTCKINGTDKYGRSLGLCYGPKGADFGQNMVLLGHAINVPSYAPDYSSDQNIARAYCNGIWSGRFCAGTTDTRQEGS